MSCLALENTQPKIYHPRRPEKTKLYQVIQNELESWLELRSLEDLPVFVEKEFRAF